MPKYIYLPALLAIFSVFMSGCCRQAAPVRSTQQDSVRVERNTEYIERIVHDTVKVEIPAQSAERTTRDSSSHLETDFATSDAEITPAGELNHTLKNKAQSRPVEVPTIERVRTVTRDSVVFRDKYVEVPVVQPLTKWQKTQIWIGRIASFIILAFCFIKLKKIW